MLLSAMQCREVVVRIIEWLTNCILPTKCIMCSNGIGGLLCSVCAKQLQFISRRCCAMCGMPCVHYQNGNKCLSCVLKPFAFVSAQGIVLYDKFAAQLLHKYKFHDQIGLASRFAELMLDHIERDSLSNVDILLPVPIHRFRMLERKYNQAALLAKQLSIRTGLAWDGCSLLRTKRTLRQHGLSAHMRYDNIKNAFFLKNGQEFAGKNVLLIDDLMTTGATLNECTKVILAHGAAEVRCITLFRAII